MSLHFVGAVAVILCLAIAVAAFRWPDRVFKRSAVAVIAAVALPFVVAFAASPFLGDGAGMGVAFILYALSASILLAAISASLGAAAQYVWRAVQEWNGKWRARGDSNL